MAGVVTNSRLERLRSLLHQVQQQIRAEEAEERDRDAHRVRPQHTAIRPALHIASYDEKRARVHPAAVRAWAHRNDYELGERGRIPEHIIDAYLAAFPQV